MSRPIRLPFLLGLEYGIRQAPRKIKVLIPWPSQLLQAYCDEDGLWVDADRDSALEVTPLGIVIVSLTFMEL